MSSIKFFLLQSQGLYQGSIKKYSNCACGYLQDLQGITYINIHNSHLHYCFLHFLPDVAIEREIEGDVVLSDMGEGVPFRPGCFDGAVSVSALQWLFNADKKFHQPVKRLYTFFRTLYASLVRKTFLSD